MRKRSREGVLVLFVVALSLKPKCWTQGGSQSEEGTIWSHSSIGVDLGGTNLRVAAYAEKAGLLQTLNLSTRRHAGRDAVISDLMEAVQTLRKTFGSSYRFTGVDVATRSYGIA